ncbi:MAG: InlB B-repeat-containing protein [Bacteroidales bacterium]
MTKKHFQLLALVALVISAIGFNSCQKEKNDDATPTSYTVTFDANGGDKAPEAETVDLEKSLTLPAKGDMTPPTDKPYFLGWDIKKNAVTPTLAAATEYTPTEDVTLYAIWATSLVQELEFYMKQSSAAAFVAKMNNEGYTQSYDSETPFCYLYINSANPNEYYMIDQQAIQSSRPIEILLYNLENVSQDKVVYLDFFESWKKQVYDLKYEGRFKGIINYSADLTATTPEEYDKLFEENKDTLTMATITITHRKYTVAVALEFYEGKRVKIGFIPN